MNRYLVEITRSEAAAEIEDALGAWIAVCEASGEPLPTPKAEAGRAA